MLDFLVSPDAAKEKHLEQSRRRRTETAFASPAVLHAASGGDLLSAASVNVRGGRGRVVVIDSQRAMLELPIDHDLAAHLLRLVEKAQYMGAFSASPRRRRPWCGEPLSPDHIGSRSAGIYATAVCHER